MKAGPSIWLSIVDERIVLGRRRSLDQLHSLGDSLLAVDRHFGNSPSIDSLSHYINYGIIDNERIIRIKDSKVDKSGLAQSDARRTSLATCTLG